MRRRFAFILLALYLCTATEAYQLLKLPLLAVHFIQHCKEDPTMTLLAFLEMHYAEEVVYDDDWQEDMQLPFKTCSHGEISLSASLRSEPIVLQFPAVFPLVAFLRPNIPDMHGIAHHAKIFQPPRLKTA
jgi:hypothetical protein